MTKYSKLLILLFLSTLIQAQSNTQAKRNLKPKDYKLWEEIRINYNCRISNDGNWYTYSKVKDQIKVGSYKDYAVFVASTRSNQSYKITDIGAFKNLFSPSSKFFGYLTREGGVVLLHLIDGKKETFPNVSNFEFSQDGKYMVYQSTNPSEKTNQLVIRTLKTGEETTFANITTFQLRPNSNEVLFTQTTAKGKSLKLITLGKENSSLISNSTDWEFKNLIWNDKGTALAFLQEQNDTLQKKKTYRIQYYSFYKNTIVAKEQLNDKAIITNLGNRHILGSKLKFTPSGDGLYFKVHGKEDQDLAPVVNDSESSDVQIWRSTDKLLYGDRKLQSRSKTYASRLAHWYPKKNKIQVLETKELPKITSISNDGKFAIAYNPLLYEPDFTFYIPKDLYLINLETGKHKLFFKGDKINPQKRLVKFSPNSKYISYFKDQQWWMYDVNKQIHTNITASLGVKWHKGKEVGAGPIKKRNMPYGSPGWTKDSKELIVYDKYDIWCISPTGKAKRLTNGRASKIKYRIHIDVLSNELYSNSIESIGTAKEINTTKGLLLRTVGYNYASGLSLWHPKKGLKNLVYKNLKIGGYVLKAKDKNAYIYKEESFNISPRIQFIGEKSSASRLLKESNTHQKDFFWGHSELIYYKGPKGEDLRGALFYPANYNPTKKYPMIIEVYEQRSNNLHTYQNPSKYTKVGLNQTNYTLDGYFVLHPDIQFTLNEVGMSALDCVNAALDKVIEKGIIDEKRVGLIGHSFGGYQTNFIITQTNRFAAAASTSGTSDLISSYHGFRMPISKLGGSNFIRAQGSQAGFTKSFYEIPEVYLGNSPILHAKGINTPLFLWAGQKDDVVDYRQSFEMYFGLRLQGKTCELAFYPDEQHFIRKKQNQLDLSKRLKAWFDKYLKP